MRITLFIVFIVSYTLTGQVTNDECVSAFFIEDISSFCSGPNSYDNTSATRSPDASPSCWPQDTENNDLWYSFVPVNTGVYIQVLGNTDQNRGTLEQPSIAVYSGSCRSLDIEACSSVQEGQENITELTLTDMVIGRIYYIRIAARNNNVGTFELCLDQFNPQIPPESDCSSAVVLCDKSPFFIENLEGTGSARNEVDGSCIREEFASVWYKWTVEQSGTLEFTLTPNNIEDDLDFAVYRLPDGLDDCANKQLVRCMASGENVGGSAASNRPCEGATGMRATENDTEEFPGCASGDNNFISAINMVEGESYTLIVNNFSRSGFGFSIDFGGTGTFKGPEPQFDIKAQLAFECDKLIFFTDESKDNGDPITEYQWNFGEGADPLFAQGNDPHEVTYESFGEKVAALTITTSKGCQVTEIISFNIEACCQETSDLDIDATKMDLSCYKSGDGMISVDGIAGFPDYLYSINGDNFQPSPTFNLLDTGMYRVGVQDIKGCEVFTQLQIDQPEQLFLDIGTQEDTVKLGFSTQFFSSFGPADRVISYEWSPPDGLECIDCPDPEVFGLGTTTYTLTIVDQDGCETSEQLTLYTNEARPIYAPNIMSLSSLNGNDQFKVITNPATEILEQVSIYDRWGGELYRRENFLFDENEDGWMGEGPNGQLVNPGVYVWMAKVRFVDGEVFTFKGDITVIK